jgi:hypothetical protein
MDSHLFVALEDAIEAWMIKHCERDEWPRVYVYENQARDMAKAAALVFDASMKGQEFMEAEDRD